ncbi:hypothetical protein [Nubsella zeaxanthinifaciens]|uniref:hypothetical protein n=1 Tax=Nubsella zeaxanthinifaciens TaxID=392412 RepID=UPI000DE2502D|nr:hypothetical protein [Nubsella zeaxanthinifaciens]
MPNNNAFCSDYSHITDCLLAIQLADKNGEYEGYPQVKESITRLDRDILRKLYLRVITIFGILNGEEGFPEINITGDYSELDFEELDFWVGFSTANISGDFFEQNFLELDFWTGYMDGNYEDYVAVFQTILNIFRELCSRSSELSDYERALIDASLMSFLDAFNALKALLAELDINPCETSNLNIFNNSTGVFLQVAGSDGENVAEGFHLRWTFTNELANNHLPKGNYFTNPSNNKGFNQPNDFVQIYRTPYDELAKVEIDFQQSRPVVNSQKRYWTYSINQVVNNAYVSNQLRIYFPDTAKYYDLASTINPNNNSFGFLSAYDGIIEITVLNKTFFHFNLNFSSQSSSTPAYIKTEALCYHDSIKESVKQTTVIDNSAAVANLVGDNLNLLRCKKPAGVALDKVSFETYHDFQLTRIQANWELVGSNFALSLNENEVKNRLESTAYPIDNLWPQYNGGTKVRASNYIDKWFADSPDQFDQSIGQLVSQYLTLSETNPRALYDIYIDGDEEKEAQKISLLDVIQMQALDYHIARMLGLGHIDTPVTSSSEQKFVYKLFYQNKKSLSSPARTNYVYLSLPTSKQDTLLPAIPVMRPVSYRLPVVDSASFMFDENGYGKRENVRVVSLGRELFYSEQVDFDFFSTSNVEINENFFQHPKPVYYGVEYRAEGESSYVKPEITSTLDEVMGDVYYAYDDSFSDGIPEVNPLPDDPVSLFVHFEKNEGIHHYAIYGINWFSRPSLQSDETSTDETVFQSKNLLFAPTDVSVQYIQKEDELIFTTTQEQSWLKSRMTQFPNQDTELTRVTFNWVDMIDVSGLEVINQQTLSNLFRANTAKLLFKPGLQLEVVGVITDMRPVAGNDDQLMLFTGGYQLLMGNGAEKMPTIANEDLARFTGSVLSTQEGQFKVIEVINEANNLPRITIEKIFVKERTDDREDELLFGSYKNYTIPAMGARFSMVENLSNIANWTALQETVELLSFASATNPVIEVDTGESIDTKYWIGGINAPAVIKELVTYENGFEGFYEITYDTASLSPHPQINIPFDSSNPAKNEPGQLHQAHVEWYKGMVRLNVADSTEKKLLQVTLVLESNPLKFYVYDAGYADQPIQISVDDDDLINVNYHPGYKAYLFSEPSPDYNFNAGYIMPPADDNDKRSLMSVQAINAQHPVFFSPIGLPSVLLARNIYEPQELEKPIAPSLKVRPDATKQAAFTFDVRFPSARKPFGFMFYRTSNINVLNALYNENTVRDILTELQSLTTDLYFGQRYLDLVNLDFVDSDNFTFQVYDALPEPYGFPTPNKAGLFLPEDTIEQKKAKLESTVLATLLPLTEQPPILKYLKTGVQTSNDLPVIRDANGDLLNPTDPRFNPFPTVRSYQKTDDLSVSYIRITDYFLSAFSRDFYFYTSAEINSQLNIGPISEFLGPVEVLNTETSFVPIISDYQFSTSFSTIDTPAVSFEVTTLPVVEQFEQLRLFRTTDEQASVSIAQMDQLFDVPVDNDVETSYVFEDDFSDLPSVPLGKTVYYSVAAVRTIINEYDELEEVLSQPSAVVSVKLVDVFSPDAPELIYDEPSNSLLWEPTTFDGTYYLFKQNSRANWEQVYNVQPPASNQLMTFQLGVLPTTDEDGDRIYHRFKVQVANSAGRLNILDNELTV